MEVLDSKALSKRKLLNDMKHTTQTQQRRLEELQLEFQRLQSDDGSGKVEEKKEEQAMVVSSKCRDVDALFFFYFVCELVSMKKK